MQKELGKIKNSHFYSKRFQWLLFVFFVLITLLISWSSDDAYHAYVMARNLAEGNGFVYNVGYRVSATTCPLFTLLTALFYAIFGHMYYVGIFLGVVFSSAAAYFVIFKFCDTLQEAFLSIAVLLGCYCFMCYTTAGLENSLLYFFGTVFTFLILKIDSFDSKTLFFLALLISLIAMTRMDAVLLFVPVICMIYIADTTVSLPRRILWAAAGLLPFILWEVFSMIYYGYPFPNTMYIKLNTNLDQADYYRKGLDFIFRSGLTDILLIAVPVLFIILAIKKRNRKAVFLAGGIVLYGLYVIRIGGDFMVGRHLTVPFLISFLGMIVLLHEHDQIQKPLLIKTLVCCLALETMWGACVRPIAKTYFYDELGDSAKTDVADEKTNYYPYTGLLPYTEKLIMEHRNVQAEFCQGEMDEIDAARESGAVGYYGFSVCGMAAFYEQDKELMYLTDGYGLMDPLLSRLPAIKHDRWRVGHMIRKEPEGYADSVATGENHITDPALHEYYDKILLIIRGDIWDKERLQTIIDMNLGKYDYLLEEYVSRQ